MAHEQAAPAARTSSPTCPTARTCPSSRCGRCSSACSSGSSSARSPCTSGLRAGLTVSASIPIAVLSISLLRALGKATILENNIVQTTGSAGESVAAGVIFTLPALIFLGFQLEYSRIFLLALHRRLAGRAVHDPAAPAAHREGARQPPLPRGHRLRGRAGRGREGRVVREPRVLRAGPGRRVHAASRTSNAFAVIRETPDLQPRLHARARRCAPPSPPSTWASATSSGPKVAGVIFAGGVFSWLVMMPAIKFFGSLVPTPIYPSTIPIAQMTSDQLWHYYIRYIGAGAVAAAGLITLMKTMPTIVAALQGRVPPDAQGATPARPRRTGRTDRDLPMTLVLARLGGHRPAAVGAADLQARARRAHRGLPQPDRVGCWWSIFGFLFVTVSSRICGLIGTSANPISGMTIATLMATCALFLVAGWTDAGLRRAGADRSAASSASPPPTRATPRRT